MAPLTVFQFAVKPVDEIAVAAMATGATGAVPTAPVVTLITFELIEVPFAFTALTRYL